MIQYRGLGDQFEEMAKNINQGMPRVMVGNEGLTTNQHNQNICPTCKRPLNIYPNQINQPIYPNIPNPIPRNMPNYPLQRQQTQNYDKSELLFKRIRNWGLWIVISLVIGYAIWRLVGSYLIKIIGG